MALLALSPQDYDVALAIIQKAHDIDLERRKVELKSVIDALVKAVSTGVSNGIARAFKG